MKMIANILVALVTLEHVYFLVLEMFLWTTPRGLATFGMTAEEAEATKVLAANQGLYNGFLAAGLIVSLFLKNDATSRAFKLFFLSCIVVAGVYGGATAATKILLVQGLPALAALAVVFFAKETRDPQVPS